MPHTLTPARERFRPYTGEETFYSDKLSLSKAKKLLAMQTPKLKPGEFVDHIAPAVSFKPSADYVAATNTHVHVGTFSGPKISLPLAEVTFASKPNRNSWSATPDTLVINHGDKQHLIARVPTPDHLIFQELAERARLIAQVSTPQIFEQLAAARAQAYPNSVRPTTPSPHPTPAPAAPAPHDMAAAIAQLKQLSELRDAGALTPEEFDQAKARLGF